MVVNLRDGLITLPKILKYNEKNREYLILHATHMQLNFYRLISL